VLVFFNPSAKHPLFIVEYSRVELADELDMIDAINTAYWAAVPGMVKVTDGMCGSSLKTACPLEVDIIDHIESEAAAEAGCLNP
jgi:hypothetical protein